MLAACSIEACVAVVLLFGFFDLEKASKRDELMTTCNHQAFVTSTWPFRMQVSARSSLRTMGFLAGNSSDQIMRSTAHTPLRLTAYNSRSCA